MADGGTAGRWVREYDAQGVHRTGTACDERSGHWLIEQLAGLGLAAREDAFRFARTEVETASLVLDSGQRFEGEAMLDGGTTVAGGIEAPAALHADGASILVTEQLPPADPAANPQLLDLRRRSAVPGIVAISPGSGIDDFVLANAHEYSEPFGPPLLQLPGSCRAAVLAAAGERRTVRLTVCTRRVSTPAFNVVAEVEGQDPALPPLVVMTPRSGWWRCASERGGGIAVWLACARALAGAAPRRPVLLTANTGHELGHLGLRHLLAARPDLSAPGVRWLHIGANFTARGSRARLQTSALDLQQSALGHCRAAGVSDMDVHPAGTRPTGEARTIYAAGNPYVSFVGSNAWFHRPDDRWPDCVDAVMLERMCEAMAGIALELAR